jgi:hypothetical protein
MVCYFANISDLSCAIKCSCPWPLVALELLTDRALFKSILKSLMVFSKAITSLLSCALACSYLTNSDLVKPAFITSSLSCPIVSSYFKISARSCTTFCSCLASSSLNCEACCSDLEASDCASPSNCSYLEISFLSFVTEPLESSLNCESYCY